MNRTLLCLAIIGTGLIRAAPATELPEGYWPLEKSGPILDVTLPIVLDPDLSALGPGEHAAIAELVAAGRIIHELYETQLHAEAHSARAALETLHEATGRSRATANLLDLFYLSKGPIATTLDNERQAFVPVAPESPGKNVYPAKLRRDEIEQWLASKPARADAVLDLRSVVRRATPENRSRDLARLDAHPGIDALRPGLRRRLESSSAEQGFYAVPYALAYATELAEVRRHLDDAAELVEPASADFAAYLRNRSRDFLTGDYESGDAAWVTGEFAELNLQIGSYETYNDNLLGIKAFYGASLLAKDVARTRELEQAMAELQAIENSLPYGSPKRVRARIPVGVYNVIADFGQARGANTATILPNDPDHSRKYGRTILMRYNILAHPALFANRRLRFDAAVNADNADDLTAEGGFDRTLWHEIGHYLGPTRTADGRDLDAALADKSDLLEELKADLVSLFAAEALLQAGFHDEVTLRAHYADGIRRSLVLVRPRPEQPYQTMQLMQFNWFMEHGLIDPEAGTGLLVIDYRRYHRVVESMLGEVLRLQQAGDYRAALEFIDRWDDWDDALHGPIAARMLDAGGFRRTLVRYAVISSANPDP